MTFLYLIIILAAFYLLLIAEFMLPTGGLLGATAVAMLVAAVVVAFSHSMLAGLAVIVLVLLTTPMVLMGLVRIWPHTPIGRRMLNMRPGQRSKTVPCRTTAHGIPIEDLVGRMGVAKTDLLPSGTIVVDSEKLDAVSSGMPIDSGAEVIVTHVEMGRIHVRPATAADATAAFNDAPNALPQSPASLEGSLDSFDVE